MAETRTYEVRNTYRNGLLAEQEQLVDGRPYERKKNTHDDSVMAQIRQITDNVRTGTVRTLREVVIEERLTEE